MLSSEGSKLARLILARHTLICKAIELDTRSESLAQTDMGVRNEDGTTRAHDASAHCRQRMQAERMLVPVLVERLDEQIERAQRRLDTVLPSLSSRT